MPDFSGGYTRKITLVVFRLNHNFYKGFPYCRILFGSAANGSGLLAYLARSCNSEVDLECSGHMMCFRPSAVATDEDLYRVWNRTLAVFITRRFEVFFKHDVYCHSDMNTSITASWCIFETRFESPACFYNDDWRHATNDSRRYIHVTLLHDITRRAWRTDDR